MEDLVKLIGEPDHSLFFGGARDVTKHIKYGDYLLSGLTTTGIQVVGYVVQIRLKWGAFGSDMYLIRDHKSSLAIHENQGFWGLTAEQIERVKPYFKYTPEEELLDNPELAYTYTIEGKYSETGFIISDKNAPARVDSCAYSITKEDNKISMKFY